MKNVAKEDMLEMGCDYWAVDYDNPPPQEEARARQNRISRIETRISKVKCAESLITALPILPAPRAPAMQDGVGSTGGSAIFIFSPKQINYMWILP